MIHEVPLPEISEHIESGDVAKILVAVGDMVAVDQPIVEIETDKAVVEVPSHWAGKVIDVPVKPGDKVRIGETLIRIDSDGKEEPKPAPEKVASPTRSMPPPAKPAAPTPPPLPEPAPTTAPPAAEPAAEISELPPPASPSVRRLARELGLDINLVKGSGPGGRISEEDVKARVQALLSEPKPAGVSHFTHRPLPDFSQWGETERQPMSKIRRITADGLAYSWVSIPHVTQIDKADITALEEFRAHRAPEVEAAGGKLTVTAILVKVVVEALKHLPQFNASLDMTTQEIVFKKFFNIGVAVDTDRGLLVPVVKNADRKSVTQIAVEVQDLAARTRSHKISPAEMDGGTFTISNLGGIGGTAFTPIVYPPQVAIIGVARSGMAPKWIDGAFHPRLMLPLALSYDHRLIDGADGARFLRWIIDALEQPLGMWL